MICHLLKKVKIIFKSELEHRMLTILPENNNTTTSLNSGSQRRRRETQVFMRLALLTHMIIQTMTRRVMKETMTMPLMTK